MESETLKTRMTVGEGVVGSLIKTPEGQKINGSFLKTNKKAFSVAEAFIAVGIGAILLAAAAPIMSKQIQYNHYSDKKAESISTQLNEVKSTNKKVESIVQDEILVKIEELKKKPSEVSKGAIMYFDLSSCPSGWEPLVNQYPDTANSFIRNQSGSGRNVGSVQYSAAPNIKGSFHALDLRAVYSGVFYNDGGTTVYGYGRQGEYHYRQQGMDFSRVSSVYQDGVTEIRPKNIALLACIKK